MKKIIIKPNKGIIRFDLSEIIRYRELFYIFAWRDIKVRYKQTMLGILWVVFQPLTTMLIFTFFFGKIGSINTGNFPYSLSVLTGLVIWGYFSGILSHASDSLVANESLLKKVYFPKIILPLSSIITSLIDFFVSFILFLCVAAFLNYFPNIFTLFLTLPIAILLATLSAIGLGLFMSSLNVKYRDVRYILPFFIQIILFVTPVIYPLSVLSETNKLILALNPLTLAIELMRFTLTGQFNATFTLIIISVISTISIFFFGIWYFRKTEKLFADIV